MDDITPVAPSPSLGTQGPNKDDARMSLESRHRRPMEPMDFEDTPQQTTAPLATTADIDTGTRDEERTDEEDESNYPTGIKLVMIVISIFTAQILNGLDLTIVAATVPSLTNQCKTVDDLGWYSAAYGLALSASILLIGKLYQLFHIKWLFIGFLCIFELGSLMCTIAQTSKMFIFGRALAGLGAAGAQSGGTQIVMHSFPRRKRPIWIGLKGAAQAVAMISSPIIGGVLIDALSWRACFGINLPLGAAAVMMLVLGFEEPATNNADRLSFKAKVKEIDFLGSCFMVPAVVCLLIALQWGGIRYGWSDWRIITLILAFAILFPAFGWRQYRLGDKATLPPRILKNRNVLAGAWFGTCTNGVLAVTEYYMSIYFQGVRGYTATRSGTLMLPMLCGLLIATITAGSMTSVIGYYTPFMLATTLLSPIPAGLLTTLNLDENLIKALYCLGALGVTVGLGLSGPTNSVQNTLPFRDTSIGLAVTGFGSGMGSAMFVVVSATLFQNRLTDEINHYAPGTNVTRLSDAGLSHIRDVVGPDRLRDVLFGYDKAVTQTLFLPLALAIATIVGSGLTEWRSVKKKQS